MAFKLKDWQIWFLSVMAVYVLGSIVAEDFGRFLGFYYVIVSGSTLGIYHIIKKRKAKNS